MKQGSGPLFSRSVVLLPRLRQERGLSVSEAGPVSGVFFAGGMASSPLLAGPTNRFRATMPA